MKIALMFLAVANILYFMWGQFVSKPVEPGVVVVNEKELGPALSVSRTSDVEAATSVGTVLGSGRSAEFAAVVGRSCVSIGPFKSSPEADATMTEYRTEGMRGVCEPPKDSCSLGIGSRFEISQIAKPAMQSLNNCASVG